jgi:hypothetical protein
VGKSGKELGVELSELWLCGTSYLPSAADGIVRANGIVAGTSADSSRFQRHGVVPGTPGITGAVVGQVYPVWDRLRDEFQTVLAESAENLYATGEALVRVADTYAATDTAAAEELKRLQGRYVAGGEFDIRNPADRPAVSRPE